MENKKGEKIKQLIKEGDEYLNRLAKALESENTEKDVQEDEALKKLLERMKELINY
jgi:hypothetical protein